MTARDAILSSIRARRRAPAPQPERYRAPPLSDLLAAFIAKAQAAYAETRILQDESDIPAAVAEILRARNMAAEIHLPPHSDLAEIMAHGGVQILRTRPGPDDAALIRAPLAVAETGTLVQPAREASPASWHFRPGLEIAVLNADDIVAHVEDALARLGVLPTTLNLITGPSRTGDIEQTMELGAHGPKALSILIFRRQG